jgi:phage N-6-adenine-methyltransferase
MSYKGAPLMSKCQKWGTPPAFIEWLETNLMTQPLDLDVCANEHNYKVRRYFTEKDNSLKQDWDSYNAFMNPPFGHGGKLQREFFEHAVHEVHVMNNCINLWALVPARTDTKLFHEIILPNAETIYLIKGRFNFKSANNIKGANAPFPSMLVHFTCLEEDKPRHQKIQSLKLDKEIRGF